MTVKPNSTSFPEPHLGLSFNMIPLNTMGGGVLRQRSPGSIRDEIKPFCKLLSIYTVKLKEYSNTKLIDDTPDMTE